MLEDKSQELTPISKLGEFGLIKHLTENFPVVQTSTKFLLVMTLLLLILKIKKW
jgi:hypothetical protein